MDMRLELVPIPVVDVDRAKTFYVDDIGFGVDIDEARRALVDRGVDVDEVADLGGGVRMAGFADPDGNTWTLQELP